jgi:hypothetical protein
MSLWTQFLSTLRAALGVNNIFSMVVEYMRPTKYCVSFDDNEQSIFYHTQGDDHSRPFKLKAEPFFTIEFLFVRFCKKFGLRRPEYRLKDTSNRLVDCSQTVEKFTDTGALVTDDGELGVDKQYISFVVNFRRRSDFGPDGWWT